jgi:hypothetical protein
VSTFLNTLDIEKRNIATFLSSNHAVSLSTKKRDLTPKSNIFVPCVEFSLFLSPIYQTHFNMIKLYLSAVLILLGFLGKAQECEGTFVFNHQSDMDAFLINNPGCTSIIGDVFIEPQNNGGPDDLLSVDGLQNISIGYFNAFNNLQSCEMLSILQLEIEEMFGFELLESVTMLTLSVNSTQPYWEFPSLTEVQSIELNNEYFCAHTPPFVSLGSVPYTISVTGNFGAIHFPTLQFMGGLHVMGTSQVGSINSIEMESLAVIPGDFSIFHTQVSELAFLESLTEESLWSFIQIGGNTNLSYCAYEILCSRIASNPSYFTIFLNAEGCNSIEEIAANCINPKMIGSAYADFNCDGVFNNNDAVFPGTIVLENQDQEVMNVIGSSGNFVVFLEQGTQTISAVTPQGFLPANPYTYTINGNEVFTDQDYAFCPEANLHNVQVTVFSMDQPRPGYSVTYYVQVTNLGAYTEDVELSFNASAAQGLEIFGADQEGVVSGNLVTWQLSAMHPFQQTTCLVFTQVGVDVETGSAFSIDASAQLTSLGVLDSYPQNNNYNLYQLVWDSFDPNDITVDRTDIPVEEINTGDPITLDYLIRFQNTGTAEAINVRIENPLSSLLDVSTLQVLSSSHDYEIEIHDNSTLHWKFDDIYLPDSATNALASQGYVLYRIKTQSGLGLTDSIHNHAEIYFDFNAPVITNTAITSFYECPTNTQIIGPLTTCADETIILTCNSEYDQYAWTMDGMSLSASSELQMADITAGSYTIVLSATSQFCEAEVEHILVVHTVPTAPVITQNNTTLSASGSGEFHWQLNGEDLATTNSTVEMTESGVYSVFVVENGCPSAQTSGQFIMSSTSEHALKNEFTVYPQPANDEIFITHNTSRSGAYTIEIHDLSGRLLFQSNMNSSTLRIDCSAFETGLYMCSMKNKLNENVSQYKLIVQ